MPVLEEIASEFSVEEIGSFLEQLSQQDWETMTPDEWRLWMTVLPAEDFKEILDYMTKDQILWVWQFFTKEMSDAFFDAIGDDAFDTFTAAEWQASFQLPASEFKRRFFDKMDLEEILEVCEYFSDVEIDNFLDDLTLEDWESMTEDELRAVYASFNGRDDIEQFVHQAYKADPAIVTKFFAALHEEDIKDFFDSFGKEDYGLLSDDEWIAIKKATNKEEPKTDKVAVTETEDFVVIEWADDHHKKAKQT